MAEVVTNNTATSWARWWARIFGVIFVILGIWGFFTPDPLGINFEFTTVHNWVHIITGIALLYFGFATNLAIRTVASAVLVFGTIYLLLGILGFFVTEFAGLILLMADNWYNLLVGITGLIAGIADYTMAREPVRARRPAV